MQSSVTVELGSPKDLSPTLGIDMGNAAVFRSAVQAHRDRENPHNRSLFAIDRSD